MPLCNRCRWLACVVVSAIFAAEVRADIITPDSIPHPPAAVGSANYTPVYNSNFVSTQYTVKGLNFESGAAITKLNGVSVWVPMDLLPGSGSPNRIDYKSMSLGASFVVPGTLTGAAATSLSVEIIGQQANVQIFPNYVYNPKVGVLPLIGISSMPNGGTLYSFDGGPGITSFSIRNFNPTPTANPAWGVAEVAFTLAQTPEPSSLLLAGLGALGWALRLSWRRVRLAV